MLSSEERPEPGKASDGGLARYVTRFNDMDAGEMHAHTALRRSLIDINHHGSPANQLMPYFRSIAIARASRSVPGERCELGRGVAVFNKLTEVCKPAQSICEKSHSPAGATRSVCWLPIHGATVLLVV